MIKPARLYKRRKKLLPDGYPRWIRCYDNNGETADRYSVVFTRANYFGLQGRSPILFMSENPWHPQGVCMHEIRNYGDIPVKAMGKKIKYTELPYNCQMEVLKDYLDYWGIKATEQNEFNV
jgi:hypothetical protein